MHRNQHPPLQGCLECSIRIQENPDIRREEDLRPGFLEGWPSEVPCELSSLILSDLCAATRNFSFATLLDSSCEQRKHDADQKITNISLTFRSGPT